MTELGAARRNLVVYRDPAIVAHYARDEWVCPGEATMVRRLASEDRGMPILDIGVGSGRTISLLSLVTDDYVGIDYSAEMVKTARQRHPYADVRVGDARDLSAFSDSSFGAVVFSFNGIDSVSHDERPRVFAEMHRVLHPNGLLAYSTLNKNWSQFPARPWRGLEAPTRLEFRTAPGRQRLLLGLRFAERIVQRIQAVPNWWRVRNLEEDHGWWGMGTLSAHDYRLLNHQMTVPAARREVEEAGFALIDMVGWSGAAVDPNQPSTATSSIFILARRGDL